MKAERLASAQSPRVKQVRKLAQRRQREKLGLFVAEGPHVVAAALDAGAPVKEAFCTAGFAQRHPTLAARLEASAWPLWLLSDRVLGQLATTEHSQGVLAVVGRLPEAPEPTVSPGLLVLALEGVADPGNVGTALRAAHGAGATAVVLGPGCCDRFNAKAVRASAGGLFAVGCLATADLAGALRRLREAGAHVVAAEPGARKPCWEGDLRGPTVVVVGSEAQGVTKSARAEAVERVAIPMPGGAESLNAAMAAGVLLYEAVRQRGGWGAGGR